MTFSFGLLLGGMLLLPCQKNETEPVVSELITAIKIKPGSNGAKYKGYLLIAKDWPEQKVEVIKAEFVRCKGKPQSLANVGGVLAVETDALSAEAPAAIIYRQKVTVTPLRKPQTSADFLEKVVADSKAKPFLQPSPGIESQDTEIRKRAKSLVGATDSAWQKAEKFAKFVKQHLREEIGPYTSAKTALRNGVGDCEERASLFIALCRSEGIPARTVFTPAKRGEAMGHCWAEIWLLSQEEVGTWIPVDVGLEQFGIKPEGLVISQKGDRFKERSLGTAWLRAIPTHWFSVVGAAPTFEYTQFARPYSEKDSPTNADQSNPKAR